MIILNLLLVVASSVCWRLGGAQGYNKLWRRLGSTACMSAIIWNVWAIPTVAIGCWSYFDKLNKLFKLPNPDKERWWNYAVANLFIQLSILWMVSGVWNIVFAILMALAIALTKHWIDKNWGGKWIFRKDVASELFTGGANALALVLNSLI